MTDKIIVRPCCICCDALERAERVVEAARELMLSADLRMDEVLYVAVHKADAEALNGALRAYDTTRADTVRE